MHAILDADYPCHLGFVRDGAPVVLPTLYARVGERCYMHGSVGSRPLRFAGEDAALAVCLAVTHVEGLAPARSAIHHAINYRSVVVRGMACQVTERSGALDALIDRIVPGRAAASRPANARELAATAVVALDLHEVSAKVRTGDPNDDPEDLFLPHWAGVLPVMRTYGKPVPADDLDLSISVPGYLTER
ncbi:pyridoxamine 5'-phosphate oxidase family protein [Actinacidiphila glaucinigra]|uniref:Nitroimidazol reductase NimA, pyridoxamine 5'-phosphate oxidase superfamily n=1 Tax=Actinacidiphila glaucinigra TaxID=235986 RepID=A0A239NCE4_9ACTN|nr:pyridoxamine 5'-phosphate oxidase family protein [Actinacidiphila glaucinigra]SNT52581.1 Nitroimidazol reductase NimA, pyridoxamine 5'-phosphate oxidase superfamily [Actinacidiphila glaucinigra]